MLQFVEKEVHSVKALFSEKERTLAAEHATRLAAVDEELRAARGAEAQVQAQLAHEKGRAETAEARHLQEAAALRAARQEADGLRQEVADRAIEVRAAREEKAKVEGEMRLVLRAMEHQKQVAARNLNQLSQMYEDWNGVANVAATPG